MNSIRPKTQVAANSEELAATIVLLKGFAAFYKTPIHSESKEAQYYEEEGSFDSMILTVNRPTQQLPSTKVLPKDSNWVWGQPYTFTPFSEAVIERWLEQVEEEAQAHEEYEATQYEIRKAEKKKEFDQLNASKRGAKKKPSSGNIQARFFGPKLVYQELLKIKKENSLSAQAYRLFVHIVRCSTQALETDGYVPVPREVIFRDCKEDVQKELMSKGLVEYISHDVKKQKCRQYRPSTSLMNRIHAAYQQAAQEGSAEVLNLANGDSRKAIAKHQLTNGTGHPISDLHRQALSAYTWSVFNRKALDQWFAERSAENHPAKSTEGRRFTADKACYDFVLSQNPVDLGNGMAAYPLSYRVQDFGGRWSHKGGGFQSCSTKMKQVARAGIKGIYNFDLKAAQLNIARFIHQGLGISTEFLDSYIDADKELLARGMGITKDALKLDAICLSMGSPYPTDKQLDYIAWADKKINTIGYRMWKESGKNKDCFNDIRIKHKKFFAPYLEVLALWHQHLLEEADTGARFIKGKEYLKSPADCTFCVTNYRNSKGKLRDKQRLAGKLAAFYLQGWESLLMRTFETNAQKYNILCQSSEHDGALVWHNGTKEQVQEAIDLLMKEVSQITGVPERFVQMENKALGKEMPFVEQIEKQDVTPIFEQIVQGTFQQSQARERKTPQPQLLRSKGEGIGGEGKKEVKEEERGEKEEVKGEGVSTIYNMAETQSPHGRYLPASFLLEIRAGSYQTDELLKQQVKNSLSCQEFVTTEQVCALLDLGDSRSSQMQAGGILKSIGWERKQKKIDKKPRWVYIPTAPEPSPSKTTPALKSNVDCFRRRDEVQPVKPKPHPQMTNAEFFGRATSPKPPEPIQPKMTTAEFFRNLSRARAQT